MCQVAPDPSPRMVHLHWPSKTGAGGWQGRMERGHFGTGVGSLVDRPGLGRVGWTDQGDLGQILTLSRPICICTSDLAGTNPSSPVECSNKYPLTLRS